MIHVDRRPSPPSLQQNGEEWNRQYCEALREWISNGKTSGKKPKATKYKQDDVRDELHKCFNDKCAYCETLTKITEAYAEIEHYKPKSVYCESSHEWNNLLLSCGACNRKKSDNFPTDHKILNPFDDEHPEEHFIYVKNEENGWIELQPIDMRGANTVTCCDLNRIQLMRNRFTILTLVELMKLAIDDGDTSQPWPLRYQQAMEKGQYIGMLKRMGLRE